MLNIHNLDQLKSAFDQMHGRVIMRRAHNDQECRMVIQRQVGSGLEVIVGLKRDSVFGPVMVFGAGGTWAEVLGDRNLLVLPMSRTEAERLVKRSKIYRMLAGYRSDKPYDLEKLYELMVSLGQLMETDVRISDLEINPVIVGFHE